LNWNYLIRGPADSPFEGGEYHGVLMFPPEYPFKPPGIKMLTPSGRFAPDKKICFSMSDFHPASWNPAWSVATILTGLLSFMMSDEITTGSINTTDADKRAWARKSHSWNIQQRKFKEAFPEYCTPTLRDLPNMGESVRGKPADTTPSQPQPTPQRAVEQLRAALNLQPVAAPPATTDPKAVVEASSSNTSGGWADIIWQKWRWGLFIAVAVIVSRLSST